MPGLPRPTITFTLLSPEFRVLSREERPDIRRTQPRDSRLRTLASAHLLLLLLLGLLVALLGLGAFFSFNLALLDNFWLRRSRRRIRRRSFGRGHNFFLHRGDVRYRLILVGQEFQFFVVRQIRYADHLTEGQFGHVHV